MTHTEKETRKKLIDKMLLKSGWNVEDSSLVITEYDIELIGDFIADPKNPYSGHQFSDYVLLGRNGKPLAVVEAKKTSVDPAIGREQAKQYCYNIVKKYGGELPFCFYTNGLEVFFWNLEHAPPQKIYSFPTRSDFERMLYLRKERKQLANELINTKIASRDYQIRAIRTVLEQIEKKKRRFLLVMATGTGKTRTCISLIDTLMRGGWIQKTLFLVDRIALQEQALDAFKEFLPDEPVWPKQGEREIATDRRIFVSTYPTMLNIIKSQENPLSSHFFDFIVVDESHRSIYNTYQEILQYFNAILLGLTATPKDVIDFNTFELFDCENGLPTFAYTFEEAINNVPPYLSDFEVMKIRTKFQEKGINERTIDLEEQKKLIAQGKNIEEIDYDGTELEKTVTNSGTNSLIVREFMEECIKDPNGVLPGKTIFFCMGKQHARRIEQVFDALYPEYSGELAKVIVSEDPRVYGKGGLLDQFKKNNFPRVAISVDMLDTGIDIREIQNLVFAKPVFSYTKFWQMIGRGTRLLDKTKLNDWCVEKDKFLVIDCWDNFEYFKLNPKGKETKQAIPLPVKLFGLRLQRLEKAIELNKQEIEEKELQNIKNHIEELPENSVVVIDAARDLIKLKEPNFWNKLDSAKFDFLHLEIKPLMRTISQADFKAMQFEKDIVELSFFHICKESEKFKIVKESVIEKISQLPLTVNVVEKEKNLIEIAQTEQFYTNITENDFDLLIARLSPLMKFIDSFAIPLGAVKLNLKDVVFTKEKVEFGPDNESASISEYKKMVEEKILELSKTNKVLQKLKNGEEISDLEIEDLGETLFSEEPYITVELLNKVYSQRKTQLIQFVKHILGLEQLESFNETVANAFNEFIEKHSYLSVRQLEFLNLLKKFLIEKEEINKKDLIQSPFTLLHPEGIRGLFNPAEIEEIVKLALELVA
ncbi:MAG: DEAD/DEAH box helicase family protein [bacterium]